MSPFAILGDRTIQSLQGLGRFSTFAGRMSSQMARSSLQLRSWRLLAPQFYEVGNRTVPVILVTGLFIGMVLAVQAVEQLRSAGLEHHMGVLVNLSVVRELGPVLAGVMLAGRVGGALTAELGTMRITEQLDALRAMGTDPIRHLVVPRVMACFLLTPLLTFYCDVMGALGGWFVAVKLSGIPSGPYWSYTSDVIEWWDLLVGVVKSFAFGGCIGLISCYKGFNCRAGAEGVGRACTQSFVASFIVILVLDFFISYAMQGIYLALWGFKPII